jgi:hypothetical protein
MRKWGRRSYQGPGIPCCSVKLLRGSFGAEELGLPIVLVAGCEAALDPDLSGLVMLPVGEQADAVAARKNLVEMIFEMRQGEMLIHRLRYLEGGLKIERDAGDDTERAQIDNDTREAVGVFLAGERNCLAIGGDEFERGDSGSQVAVVHA